MANEVFFFDSTDVGAPTLNNAAGTVISVLDACLINGFNSKSVTSIVVASEVATVTCTSHGFVAVPGKYVEISGATPSGLNGKKLVTSVANANTFTFAAPGIADGTATGTITVKRAGIGWTKAFSGTNKAAYKSSDPASTGLFLRIDDTNAGVASATDARAVMYETMSDVDTGTGACPTAAQLSGGQFWNKGVNNTTAKTWTLIGDGRLFYLFTQSSTFSNQYAHAFGDIVSYRAADAYGCIVSGGAAAFAGGGSGANPFIMNQKFGDAPASYSHVLCRIASATGASVRANNISLGRDATAFGGGGLPTFPSPVDNGVVMSKQIYVTEENTSFNHPIRGELPGAIATIALTPFNHLELVSSMTGLSGTAVAVSTTSSGTAGGLLFDISNAWRS